MLPHADTLEALNMKPHVKVVMPFVAYLPGQSSSLRDNAVSRPEPSFWYLDPCPSKGMHIVFGRCLAAGGGRIV
jgi:hypothetical protein